MSLFLAAEILQYAKLNMCFRCFVWAWSLEKFFLFYLRVWEEGVLFQFNVRGHRIFFSYIKRPLIEEIDFEI